MQHPDLTRGAGGRDSACFFISDTWHRSGGLSQGMDIYGVWWMLVPVMNFPVVSNESFDKGSWIVVIENARPGFLFYFLHNMLDLGCDAADHQQDAD